MKRVFIARGVSEAHLIRAYLENAGIDAIVRGEDLSTVFGGIPIDGDSLPSVWVLDEDNYAPAMDLIRETSPSAEPGEDHSASGSAERDWSCPACDERVDGSMLVCWNCGLERDTRDAPSRGGSPAAPEE
jgi:hypothetical protein